MKSYVITCNQIEGFHYWKDAPMLPHLCYLRNKHRHNFIVTCWFEVSDEDREIEIVVQQHEIEYYIRHRYGSPAQFENMSCENIAHELLDHFPACKRCQVTEDGYGGALLEK